MDIESIDKINTTTNITFQKIIEYFPDKEIPLWIPTNYNNLIHNQSGKIETQYNGDIQFIMKQTNLKQNRFFNLFNKNTTFKCKITITSNHAKKYLLLCNNEMITIKHSYNNITNVYDICFPISESDYKFYLTVDSSDNLEWNIEMYDKQSVFLNINFIPNYKSILSNLHTITKKNNDRRYRSLLILSEILTKKNKNKQKHQQKLNKQIKYLINENNMLKTNLNKYRTENKKIALQLHNDTIEYTKLKKTLDKEVSLNYNNTKKIKLLKTDLTELKNLNHYFTNENKSLETKLKKIKQINLQCNNIEELQLKIDYYKQKLTSEKHKIKFMLPNIKDIFRWYKQDALPPSEKKIKITKNELQEYIQNLENEVISAIKIKIDK